MPFTRPKRNISRDFSDGVLVAEVVKHFYPKEVDLHNYPAANSATKKIVNWETLNTKLFKRFGLQLSKNQIEAVVSMTPMAIEGILHLLRVKMTGQRHHEPKNQDLVMINTQQRETSIQMMSEVVTGHNQHAEMMKAKNPAQA